MAIASSLSFSFLLLSHHSSPRSHALPPRPSRRRLLNQQSLFFVGSRQNPGIPRSGAPATNFPAARAEAKTYVEREPMVPPYNILITGSTKGIGYALAKEFLKAGDNVLVCSRSAERVDSTVKSLREEFGEQRVVQHVMSKRGRMSRI